IDYVSVKSPSSTTSGAPVDIANAQAIVGALESLGSKVILSTTTVQQGPPIAGSDICTPNFTLLVPRKATIYQEKYFNIIAHDTNGPTDTMGSNQLRLRCEPNNAVCGNGVKELGEQCDDGNNVACDGCAPNCRLDNVCGDGIVECGEQCDDGAANGTPGSQCS